jgi:DNA-binding response OmpR family regulator
MTEITIKSPEELHDIISATLSLYQVKTPVKQEVAKDNTITCIIADQEKTYKPPIRLGQILDFISESTNTHKTPKIITLGECTLNTHNFVFTNEKDKPINLTEKETKLLIYLHQNKENAISRETLLKAVWNYADDVETHTLETHIYRLRKKIEKDPSKPKILITTENGYTL